FTRSLAVSLAPTVRVNCIAPGWIRTAWGERASEVWQDRVVRETPLARWGTPADIAWLARFLASDQAGYITGQVINANGGAVRERDMTFERSLRHRPAPPNPPPAHPHPNCPLCPPP